MLSSQVFQLTSGLSGKGIIRDVSLKTPTNVYLNGGKNVQILYFFCGENSRFVISCAVRNESRKSLLIGIWVDSSKYWSLLMNTSRIVMIISYGIDAFPTLILSALIDRSKRI